MSCDDFQSTDHGEDDRGSWRWSVEAVASTSSETDQHDDSTGPSDASLANAVTAETVPRIPSWDNLFHVDIDPSRNVDFHGRQIECVQQQELLTAKHISALTVSLQQYSDIIGRDPVRVGPQAEMLVGLQVDLKVEPPAGIPADLHTDLAENPKPSPSLLPKIIVDDEADDASFACQVEGAYATAYQMGPPGMIQHDYGMRDTMRREAAIDDAIFRPDLRQMRRIMFSGRYVSGEPVALVAVHKPIRKRKRENKDGD